MRWYDGTLPGLSLHTINLLSISDINNNTLNKTLKVVYTLILRIAVHENDILEIELKRASINGFFFYKQ